MRLLFVRHGESEGNAAGIIQGRLDFGLTSLGRRQALLTARSLSRSGFEAQQVISSPLLRARETADAIADVLGLGVDRDEALAEYDMGEVSGLTGPEIRAKYPDVIEAFRRGERPTYPGEEGRDNFTARVNAFLKRAKELDAKAIAVAHGGVLNAVCHIVLGVDYRRPGVFHVDNCSITEVATDRTGRYVLVRHNDRCHLHDLESADGELARTIQD